MVECIGPEFYSKISSGEEGSNRIGQGPVSSLDRAILEGSFCSSGSDFITFGSKEVSNIRVVVKFPSLIQVDVFVLARVPRGIL